MRIRRCSLAINLYFETEILCTHLMKTDTSTALAQPYRAFKWGFGLWLVAAFVVLFLSTVLITASLVRYAMTVPHRHLTEGEAQMVITVAAFPGLVVAALQDLSISGFSSALLLDRKATERPNWVRRFPAPEDTGYLLFSGIDPVAKKSLVQLIRIADGHVVAQWSPDWKAIYDKTSDKKWESKGNVRRLHAVHPLLLAGGDIVFNTAAALVRLSTCSMQPVFVLDRIMHHSLELDESGSAIWGPSVAQDGITENAYLNEAIRDDSLAHVSLNGQVLENRSFSRILLDNGLGVLLLGHFGATFNFDPIHINQIQVAKNDSRFWLRGDLLISAAQMNTLFLYRPSTNKIIWHQTGPWMKQHSAEFVGDHSISVFDNNVVTPGPKGQEFFTLSDTNRVMVYDFETRQVTEPFAALLAVARPLTTFAGRARVLPDGGLFVEETEQGRHLRFSADRLLWSRVNDFDAKRIGIVAWSRYLTADEASVPLTALSAQKCPSTRPNP